MDFKKKEEAVMKFIRETCSDLSESQYESFLSNLEWEIAAEREQCCWEPEDE